MQQHDNETTIRGPFGVSFGNLLTAPPNRFDLALLPIILAAIVLVAYAARQMNVPYTPGEPLSVSLDVAQLPYYLLRTSIRMLLALGASLLFSFAFAAIASRNRTAEKVMVPALDILQSIPVLGFLSITVTGFIALFPAAWWAWSARRSSRSSPRRRGTWRSRCTSRSAPFRPT